MSMYIDKIISARKSVNELAKANMAESDDDILSLLDLSLSSMQDGELSVLGVGLFVYLLENNINITRECLAKLVYSIIHSHYIYLYIAEPYLNLTKYYDEYGRSILHILIYELEFNKVRNQEVLADFSKKFRILISLGADPFSLYMGRTPLDYATINPEIEQISKMVKEIYENLDRPAK